MTPATEAAARLMADRRVRIRRDELAEMLVAVEDEAARLADWRLAAAEGALRGIAGDLIGTEAHLLESLARVRQAMALCRGRE